MQGIAEKSDDKKQKICFCYVTIRGLFLGFYIHIFPDECRWGEDLNPRLVCILVVIDVNCYQDSARAQRCLTPLRPDTLMLSTRLIFEKKSKF